MINLILFAALTTIFVFIFRLILIELENISANAKQIGKSRLMTFHQEQCAIKVMSGQMTKEEAATFLKKAEEAIWGK